MSHNHALSESDLLFLPSSKYAFHRDSDLRPALFFTLILACSLFVWFWYLLLTTTTLDSPFATSAALTNGFDPPLFYGHSLASDSVTPANLISMYDFGTSKQLKSWSASDPCSWHNNCLLEYDDMTLPDLMKHFVCTNRKKASSFDRGVRAPMSTDCVIQALTKGAHNGHSISNLTWHICTVKPQSLHTPFTTWQFYSTIEYIFCFKYLHTIANDDEMKTGFLENMQVYFTDKNRLFRGCISVPTLNLIFGWCTLAAITASRHLGKKATSLAHLFLDTFARSSWHILASSVRLDRECRYTAIFSSFHKCSIGFRSGLWLAHSQTFSEATPLFSRWLFGKLHAGCHVPFTKEWLPSDHYHKGLIGGVLPG